MMGLLYIWGDAPGLTGRHLLVQDVNLTTAKVEVTTEEQRFLSSDDYDKIDRLAHRYTKNGLITRLYLS